MYPLPNPAKKLNELKKLVIGGSTLNIGTYYYDHQVFIKAISPEVSEDRLKTYFSNFGEVDHIVMSEPFEKKGKKYRRSYIKMKDDSVVDSIVLARAHSIDAEPFKCIRTFGLDEDK